MTVTNHESQITQNVPHQNEVKTGPQRLIAWPPLWNNEEVIPPENVSGGRRFYEKKMLQLFVVDHFNHAIIKQLMGYITSLLPIFKYIRHECYERNWWNIRFPDPIDGLEFFFACHCFPRVFMIPLYLIPLRFQNQSQPWTWDSWPKPGTVDLLGQISLVSSFQAPEVSTNHFSKALKKASSFSRGQGKVLSHDFAIYTRRKLGCQNLKLRFFKSELRNVCDEWVLRSNFAALHLGLQKHLLCLGGCNQVASCGSKKFRREGVHSILRCISLVTKPWSLKKRWNP